MTVEELQLLIASSVESGNIEAEERELLSNIFEFGETVASEVMIPRTSIDAVPETATVQEVLAEVAESGHSRYPVFGESLDDIRGLIHVKEVDWGAGQGIHRFAQPHHQLHPRGPL
jgi:CBS domain containing-hemolysin-like protein